MNREIAGIAPQSVADGETDLPGHFRGASPALHGQRVIGRLRNAATRALACMSQPENKISGFIYRHK